MYTGARPSVPQGIHATYKLHVWLRTDARLITYDDRQGAKHEGLNQLVKDIGGRHRDVVIGNGENLYQYGLQYCLVDYRWLEVPNGDGILVDGYGEEYEYGKGQVLQYIGHVKDGRRTLESIARIVKAEARGKTYDHRTYNCATFAAWLVDLLA